MDGLAQLGSIFTGGGSSTGGTTPPTFPGGSIPGISTASAAPAWQQLLLGGMFGAGELGNLLTEHKQSQYTDNVLNYQKNLMQYAQDPSKLTSLINAQTKPLDNALVQSINNRVQGDLASRGLAQAPGIFATTEAQALAPFQQQNSQQAQQQVLAALGLPGTTPPLNIPQPQSMAPALAAFLRSFGTRPQQQGQPTAIPQAPPDFSGFTYSGGAAPPSFASYPVATDPFEGGN